MTDTDESTKTPTPRKRRRPPRPTLTMQEIKREIALREAAVDKEIRRIANLKLDLEQNARQQKAQSGLQIMVRTLEGLHPAEVATFIGLLSPYVGREQDLEDVYCWQAMHAELAAPPSQIHPTNTGEST